MSRSEPGDRDGKDGDAPLPDEAAVPHPVASDGAARRIAERARDAAEASRDRFAFLAETSRCLADSLDYETTLQTVAGMSLPYLGAWCIVDLCGDDGQDGEIRRLVVLHPDPNKQATARALAERYPPRPADPLGAPRVIRTGRPEVVVEVSDEALVASARDAEHLKLLRALGTGAYVIAPMVARGRTVGAMTFVTAEAGRRFGDLDVLLAEDLATRAALAVDNARLHHEALRAKEAAVEARAMAEVAQAGAQLARAAAEVARAEADAANRAKSEFLAVMSHELRTPLNAISGYVDLIEMGLRGPVTPEQRIDLERIQRSERHLMGLINGVLNFARMDVGAVPYALQDVAVGEVLAACATLVEPQAASKGITLTGARCDPALTARADAEKLEQVVLNLLTNAVKFTAPRGKITMECSAADDAIIVTVADTGQGIAPEQLERIFEPFVQLDSRLSRAQQGVGLGLAISRDLARGMGGDLTAASTPKAGSTFTLRLPRV